MNIQDNSICLLLGQNDPTAKNSCPLKPSEGISATIKQEGSDPEMAGLHWSGQPGKDLFFNNWKLLF